MEIFPQFLDALEGIKAGSEVLILTWFHLSNRDVLQVHPRGDTNRPLTGVFATRSPERPDPIGLHKVTVLEVDTLSEPSRRGLKVFPIEAVDGTPVIDIKSVLRDGDA